MNSFFGVTFHRCNRPKRVKNSADLDWSATSIAVTAEDQFVPLLVYFQAKLINKNIWAYIHSPKEDRSFSQFY